MKTSIKEMRAKIVALVDAEPDDYCDRTKLKLALGLKDYEYSPKFEQACKTVKLTPIWGKNPVTYNGIIVGHLRPFIAGFKLATREK